MADIVVVDALRRFLKTTEALEFAYRKAFEAYQARATEVVITSSTFSDGNSAGQIAGDPKDMMEACEFILQEKEAAASGEAVAQGPVHSDFSRTFTRT